MIPKVKRIKNPQAVKDAIRPYCELCGRAGVTQPHHIIFKGQGGHDIPENLISLCIDCHNDAHGKGPARETTPKEVFYRVKEGNDG